ncbi:MAG: hypothetical protein WDN04_13930 [Rhodospirillales bacterium]
MSGSQSQPFLGATVDPFSVSVKRWCNKAKGDRDRVYRAIVLDLVARVKELTPVRTGYLRSNWTAVLAGDSIPIAGQASPPEVAIAQLHYGQGVLIVNPVVYARRVEFGFVGEDSLGRHYDQEGRGMLQQTLSELPQIARHAAERVQAGEDQE